MIPSTTTLEVHDSVGREAPDFELTSIDGELVRLSSLRGQRVVLWLSRGIY